MSLSLAGEVWQQFSHLGDESAGDIQQQKPCPFCEQLLPSPWPRRIQEKYDRTVGSRSKYQFFLLVSVNDLIYFPYSIERLSAVEQYGFCLFHDAELVIVPAGLAKGYPLNIDFDSLPERIKRLETPLKRIITGESQSEYKSLAERSYTQLGRRAATPAGLWGRFEQLQVNLVERVCVNVLETNKYSLDWVLWTARG